MSGMDVKRAMSVLNRASENHMYDAERIPEGDAEKITAAEQIVQLCHQVEQVVRANFQKVDEETGELLPLPDERVIAQKVPHWPGVVRILAEVEVKMVASGSPTVQYVEQEPEVVAPVQEPPKSAVGPPATDSPAPAPDAAPSLDRRDPAGGEVWLDQMGNAWAVLHYSGGTSAEVRSVASGEKTIVPAGFLKTCQIATQIPVQGAEAPVVVDQAQDVGEAVDYALSDGPPAESLVEKDASPHVASPAREEIRDAINTDVDAKSDSSTSTDGQTPTQQQYDALVDDVESRYMPTGMPFPTDLDSPPETHAEMFADVDDATARILHSKYNALAARAKYLHDLEDAISRECDLVRTYHMRRALGKARHEAERDATLKEVTMVAEADELVSEWAGYARSHYEEARALKTFHDIYTQHVVVLSRDWSMREAQVR